MVDVTIFGNCCPECGSLDYDEEPQQNISGEETCLMTCTECGHRFLVERICILGELEDK